VFLSTIAGRSDPGKREPRTELFTCRHVGLGIYRMTEQGKRIGPPRRGKPDSDLENNNL
jgi:hypothetical protein